MCDFFVIASKVQSIVFEILRKCNNLLGTVCKVYTAIELLSKELKT